MGARYLITGVQLGMLIALPDLDHRQQLVDKIERDQYVCTSDNDIKKDVKFVSEEIGIYKIKSTKLGKGKDNDK
jgi:hypothetical protein